MIMSALGDSQLLQAYTARRDAEAFAEIVRRHAGMVYGVARRITGSAHDAEDVALACFIELAGKAGSITSSLAGWLHRAATFRARDLVRQSLARRERERNAIERRESDAASWEQIEPLVDESL